MKRTRFDAVFVLGAGLALAACVNDDKLPQGPETTSATALVPRPAADGWIHFENTLVRQVGLIRPVTKTTVGPRDENGFCENVSVGDYSGEDDGPHFEEDIAFNPTTCERTTVRGGITAEVLAKLDDGTLGDQGPMVDDTTKESNLALPDADYDHPTIAATLPHSAYVKTAWIDPLNITITSLADDIQWNSHLAMSSEVNNYKFRYDGWSVSPSRPPIVWHSGSGWRSTSSYDTFRNTDFEAIIIALFGLGGYALCEFDSSPAIFKHNIQAIGHSNGSRGATWSDSAKGGCTNLVHHREWDGFGTKH